MKTPPKISHRESCLLLPPLLRVLLPPPLLLLLLLHFLHSYFNSFLRDLILPHHLTWSAFIHNAEITRLELLRHITARLFTFSPDSLLDFLTCYNPSSFRQSHNHFHSSAISLSSTFTSRDSCLANSYNYFDLHISSRLA